MNGFNIVLTTFALSVLIMLLYIHITVYDNDRFILNRLMLKGICAEVQVTTNTYKVNTYYKCFEHHYEIYHTNTLP